MSANSLSDPALAKAGSEIAPTEPAEPRRIVITTFGSLGDVHPYIAVSRELIRRGHQVVIATSPLYREKIETLGIGFAPVRPDIPEPTAADAEFMRKVMDLRTGSEFIIRELMMPHVRDAYADTLAAAQGADLVVSHPLTFTTQFVAETLNIPWASTMLAPLGFFSPYDVPVLPQAQWLARFRWLGPGVWTQVFRLARFMCRSWSTECHKLRAEIGLPPSTRDPLFEGQHSPYLTLAMFSKQLGDKQPDWPASARVTGFAFYDQHEEHQSLAPELVRFLEEGEPPIVFTLGSSAVMDAGPFYEYAAQAAHALKRRAILLIGKDERNRLPSLPEGVIAWNYAPYSELFPRAAAIVHQGGAGTTGQTLRSGKPALVMPYAHDQPDNAARVVRLGTARTIPRSKISPHRLERELRILLDDCHYSLQATEVGAAVRAEDGTKAACDALEELLKKSGRRQSSRGQKIGERDA